MTSAYDINPGDIVPYRNTASRIVFAQVESIENARLTGKPWFHGIDTKTKAKVWYSCTCSAELINDGHNYINSQP